MNIRTMRFMDYWIGRPLCFLFSLLNFILKTVSFSRKTKDIPEKVLFIKLSELGAIVLAYPFLKQLKRNYPLAQLFFVTFEKNRDVFELLDAIVPDENILVISDRSFWSFAADTVKLIAKIRRKKIDIVFDLEFFSRFSSILSYLSGGKKRVGFYRYTFEGLYRGELLTHKVLYNPLNHVVKSYLSLEQVIREENKNSPELKETVNINDCVFPEYKTQNNSRKELQNKIEKTGFKIGRVFLINPGEGVLPAREWPLDSFIALSRLILEEENAGIIFIGTEGADNKAKLMQKTLNNPRCIDLVGQTTLAELMELFLISDVLISNDCGLVHLAMLTPIKKFVLFGPESPQVFGPLGDNNYILYTNWLCSPCLSVLNHRDSACLDNKCLKNIRPEKVYALFKDAL